MVWSVIESWRTQCLLLLLFLSLAVSGCMRLSNGKPPGPWHDAYQPIEDPDTDAFLAEVLDLARAEFGDPVIPINRMLLRRSKKTSEARRYRIGEDFSLSFIGSVKSKPLWSSPTSTRTSSGKNMA